MSWITGLLVFVVLWWLVLFAVLPWGVRTNDGRESGHDAGAPVNPALWRKAAVTTLIAGVIFGAVYWTVDSGVFDHLIHRK